MERLDKFLVSQNIGSRKEAARLVRGGAVTVNGQTAKDPAQKLDPALDRVAVDGREVAYRKHLYIMMNKPAGVLSATEDKHAPTVLDLLPPDLQRRGLFPAGRLDKDTTGLLLITDDGDFAHRMLAPKSHVYKRYQAVTERPVTQEDVEAFAAGIRRGELQFAPARLWSGEEEGRPVALVEIREGKFHQVKRMFEATGNRVLELRRLAVGGLVLDPELGPGECRLLSEEEAASVFERVLILDEGHITENSPTDELLGQFRTVSGRADQVEQACQGLTVLTTQEMGRRRSCTVRGGEAQLERLAQYDVEVAPVSLQGVFVALCGHGEEV